MAYTQADVDALRAEIVATGTATVLRSGDQETRFATIDEKLKLLAVMVANVATSSGRTRTRYASTSKGV